MSQSLPSCFTNDGRPVLGITVWCLWMILFACFFFFFYILNSSSPLFLFRARRDFSNSFLSELNLGVCAVDSQAPSRSERPWLASPRLPPGGFTHNSATGSTGWGAKAATSSCLWEDLCPFPDCHLPSHFPETEKGLDLWVWFITHKCGTSAFSQVLANITGNFCQQPKYLEIRRHILLPNKSSF